jgi:transcription elongation factor SPT6
LLKWQEIEVEDYPIPPEEVAASNIGRDFGGPDAVLKGARHMASIDIAADPGVRAFVQGEFMPTTSTNEEKEDGRPKVWGAVVSTKPTAGGNEVIDDFHQYAGVKWLREKPVREFRDGQWLTITRAVDEGLLEVTVGLLEDARAELLKSLEVRELCHAVVCAFVITWSD